MDTNGPIEDVNASRPLDLLQALLADPHSRPSLECERGIWRLWWFAPDDRHPAPPPYEKRMSEILPDDPAVIATLQERLAAAKAWRLKADKEAREAARADAKADPAAYRCRWELRRDLLIASGRGQWMRKRIGEVFDVAAALGDDWLADFIRHEPRKARPKPAGSPRRPAGGWGSADTRPPVDMLRC